jgi:hypothetical protein
MTAMSPLIALTGQLTENLTGKAYSDKTGMSLVGTTGKMENDSSNSYKTGVGSDLGTVCPPMSSKKLTEQEGFEPSEPFGSMVFKTIAISHSATAPEAHFVRIRLRFYSNLPLDQGFFGETEDFHKKCLYSDPCKSLVFGLQMNLLSKLAYI